MLRANETDSTITSCSYCHSKIDDDNYLECEKCKHNVHIKCLPHACTPGDLLGDVFFDFTCIKCMRAEMNLETEPQTTVTERCVRQRIPWLLVITLALYNLSIKSKGLGHHGFFHWRTHIISFVNKNWVYIFGPRVRRRKQWTGSVSGTLSHNSPEYFQSGLDVFQEHGWWKLAKPNQTPRAVFKQYELKHIQRQKQRVLRRLPPPDENSCSSELSVTDNHTEDKLKDIVPAKQDIVTPSDGCARTLPYMGCAPKLPQAMQTDADLPPEQTVEQPLEEAPHQPLSTVQASLMDFLAENLGGDDLTMFNSLPGIMPEPLIGAGKNDFFMTEALLEAPASNNDLFELENNFVLPPSTTATAAFAETTEAPVRSAYTAHSEVAASDENASSSLMHAKAQSCDELAADSSEAEDQTETDHDIEQPTYQPRIVQITNYQAQEVQSTREQQSPQFKDEPMDELPDETEEAVDSGKPILDACKPSGFVRQPRRNWPWLVEATDNENETETGSGDNLTLMSVYEEQELHQRLQHVFTLEQRCKLHIPAHIRRLYRKLCVRKWKRDHNRPIFNLDEHIDPTARAKLQQMQQAYILDRYQLIAHSHQDARTSFYARIAGSTQYEMFESPYSQRVLHPFIYRNKSMGPPWLRLMCELQHRISGEHPTRSTIDFCYVRPQHIPAVNALLQSAFWPGIDVSECLSYPDYSVVALYKKLVVGCGFLVPDVGYNEAYISFMAVRPHWQRSGIGTFMLYHLIQTCLSKDITLHVSASNTAVLLYQKFGFKIEEIILDFYDKYLPLDSKHSRTAFFLRLLR